MWVFSRYNFFKISYGKLGHLKICISFSNALTCNTVVIVPDLNTASSVVKSSWILYNYNKNGFCWISLSLSLSLSLSKCARRDLLLWRGCKMADMDISVLCEKNWGVFKSISVVKVGPIVQVWITYNILHILLESWCTGFTCLQLCKHGLFS